MNFMCLKLKETDRLRVSVYLNYLLVIVEVKKMKNERPKLVRLKKKNAGKTILVLTVYCFCGQKDQKDLGRHRCLTQLEFKY